MPQRLRLMSNHLVSLSPWQLRNFLYLSETTALSFFWVDKVGANKRRLRGRPVSRFCLRMFLPLFFGLYNRAWSMSSLCFMNFNFSLNGNAQKKVIVECLYAFLEFLQLRDDSCSHTVLWAVLLCVLCCNMLCYFIYFMWYFVGLRCTIISQLSLTSSLPLLFLRILVLQYAVW